MGSKCNVVLFEEDDTEVIRVSKSDRLDGGMSSLGVQDKWYNDGRYIKLNTCGYEGVAEILASHLLRYSDLPSNLYTPYYSCIIEENGKVLGSGCYSYNFLNDDESELSFFYWIG